MFFDHSYSINTYACIGQFFHFIVHLNCSLWYSDSCTLSFFRTSKCLIKSVLDLKDNNWGRSRSSNPVTPEDSYPPNYQQAANFTQVHSLVLSSIASHLYLLVHHCYVCVTGLLYSHSSTFLKRSERIAWFMLGLTPVTLQPRTMNLELILWTNTCAYINGIICYNKCGIVKFHWVAKIHVAGQGLWSSGEFLAPRWKITIPNVSHIILFFQLCKPTTK